MSENNPIRVFVTHTFDETAGYLRVFEYLESVENFFYINTSRPDDMPSGSTEAFKNALLEQIKASEIVVVLASLYDRKHEWVKYQIECARANSIPVIAIRAFGGTVMLSDELTKSADAVLDWNAREIVDAIRAKARGEDTNRWEVIDFP